MPRTTEETRDLFDRWAETYDQDLETPSSVLEGYPTSLGIAVANLTLLPQGAQVLDVGVGTGSFAEKVEERFGAHISGVDPSAAMREKCQQQHPTWDLREGVFTALPFPDSAFDAIISSFAFHEVLPQQRAQACAELARVLRPGGWLCLLDIMFASDSAQGEARLRAAQLWDDEEDYARIGTLDELLRAVHFVGVQWRQTAPCHWLVLARKRE